VRVLIDESLPRQLARELSGCEGRTVQQQGWSSLENGELLIRWRTLPGKVLSSAQAAGVIQSRNLGFTAPL
jgi:hypothetical protein